MIYYSVLNDYEFSSAYNNINVVSDTLLKGKT